MWLQHACHLEPVHFGAQSMLAVAGLSFAMVKQHYASRDAWKEGGGEPEGLGRHDHGQA